jgi:adenosine deaminase
VDCLHVERIDHGVRCVEDPALVARILAAGLGFTVCPVSNVRIGPYPSMREHPIDAMVGAGLTVCVNSDDPAYLGAYICDNYAAVAQAFGYSLRDLGRFAADSFRMSFLPAADKERWIAQVWQTVDALQVSKPQMY